MTTVENEQELRRMVQKKETRFLVRGDFTDVVKKIKAGQLGENERLGFNVGAGGWGGLQTYLIDYVLDIFSKRDVPEVDNRLKTSVQTLYDIKILDNSTAALTLKQENY